MAIRMWRGKIKSYISRLEATKPWRCKLRCRITHTKSLHGVSLLRDKAYRAAFRIGVRTLSCSSWSRTSETGSPRRVREPRGP